MRDRERGPRRNRKLPDPNYPIDHPAMPVKIVLYSSGFDIKPENHGLVVTPNLVSAMQIDLEPTDIIYAIGGNHVRIQQDALVYNNSKLLIPPHDPVIRGRQGQYLFPGEYNAGVDFGLYEAENPSDFNFMHSTGLLWYVWDKPGAVGEGVNPFRRLHWLKDADGIDYVQTGPLRVQDNGYHHVQMIPLGRKNAQITDPDQCLYTGGDTYNLSQEGNLHPDFYYIGGVNYVD
jgi:hypothetical protein